MKFAEQQSTSSMIKCLLFRLFSIHYNGSINSPTRCFSLIQHRPMFYERKKNNMMSWQHAIHLLKVLMTGNIWKKKWLFWMTHEYTRCPIQLSQSKSSIDSTKRHWFRRQMRKLCWMRVQSLKCLHYYRKQFNRHQCMQTIRTV